jgi:SAM-dependent methyltransferase
MRRSDSKHLWETVARHQPYWGVITLDKYLAENLGERTLEDFFASGEEYVGWVFDTITSQLCPNFRPDAALDFGCGVGRVLIPLAPRCGSVVGVDVAEGMLREARSNCDARELANVGFVCSDDSLHGVGGPFGLVHTFIVLQHIPPRRGYDLVKKLLGLLDADGVGVLHVPYGSRDTRRLRTVRTRLWLWRRVCMNAARRLSRVVRPGRRPPKGPRKFVTVPSYEYDLGRVLRILQEGGVSRIHLECTDHGGLYGVILFFLRSAADRYSA